MGQIFTALFGFVLERKAITNMSNDDAKAWEKVHKNKNIKNQSREIYHNFRIKNYE